ncbi:MAG TPA: hypothetical protein VGH97_07535 [Thermoanaerobaculia bacterium]
MGQETPRPPSRSLLARPFGATLYAIAFLVVAAAALSALRTAHADRMSLATGRAEWIWYSSGTEKPRPLRFFATREFLLPGPPTRATAKVFVDRDHTLFVNGGRVGGGSQRPGDPLRLYGLVPFLREGANRIVIEASSPSGVGGILFSLDCDAYGRDALVSDGRWRVDLSPLAETAGGRYRPMVWGRPPQPPWGYPRMPRPEELAGSRSPGPGS